jgi:hypothetical protein
VAPLHRAIQVQNYKAIYLLLQSGMCNLFVKDKEFKTGRDYCQKILFLSKYLRKGESNYLKTAIVQAFPERLRRTPLISSSQNKYISPSQYSNNLLGNGSSSPTKGINHSHLNFFSMASKRGNRVKYNSWYSKVNGGLQFGGGANSN